MMMTGVSSLRLSNADLVILSELGLGGQLAPGELLSDEARAHYQVARAREGISNKALQVPQVKTLKQQAVIVYEEFFNRSPRF